MKSMQTNLVTAAVVALVAAWVLPVQASELLDSGSSYAYIAGPTGSGPGLDGAWYGSSPYADSSLNGTVDWAVFTPTQFSAAFPGSSFVPTPNELVYAYQVVNNGTSDASQMSMTLFSSADNIGSFSNLAGTAPSSEAIVEPSPVGSATWSFDPTTIPGNGNSSVGLAYSSPYAPASIFGAALIDSGLQASTETTVVTPSQTLAGVPEPSALILLAVAAILMWLRRIL